MSTVAAPQLPTDPEGRAIIARLAGAGFQAVFVGGAVRDALRGLPAKDWDVATSARPEQVMALFPGGDGRSSRFGTVFVPVGAGRPAVEVTTFRGDGDYRDGRRPERVVLLDDLRADLARRDLTVNALAYDPLAGLLHDPFGGLADLRARVLRAVGDPAARLAEDPLRAVRLARFAASTGFAVDPATERAIAGLGPRVADSVSPERLGGELLRLAAAAVPAAGLRLLARSGIAEALVPSAAGGAAARLERALAALDRVLTGPAAWLGLLAASATTDGRAWAADGERLALERRTVEAVADRLRVAHLRDTGLGRADLLRRLPVADLAVDDGLRLRRALARAGLVEDDRGALAGRVSVMRRIGLPRHRGEMPIDGRDLLELGLRGPDVGRVLDALWEDAAEGRVRRDRAALLERAAVRAAGARGPSRPPGGLARDA